MVGDIKMNQINFLWVEDVSLGKPKSCIICTDKIRFGNKALGHIGRGGKGFVDKRYICKDCAVSCLHSLIYDLESMEVLELR